MSADDDASLVRRIGEGDPAAERLLCERLAPRLRLVALRAVRNEETAADLVQETLVTVLRALRAGKIDEPAAVRAFAAGTCRNLATQSARVAKRRERLLEAMPYDAVAERQSELTSIDLQRMTGCLGTLSERERGVLQMTFFDERSPKEIASAFDLSEANVRVVRHRALVKLRECVGEART